MLQLTPEQKKVAAAIMDYVLHKPGLPYLAVAGYAGTGKTTVMGYTGAALVRELPNLRIAYCAPTGKAASVLSQKLRDFGAFSARCTVNTVHGLIYNPYDDNGRISFNKKPCLESDLIVVDESSMLTREMARDILSFELPVVFIGDSGQLPPVGDSIFAPLVDTDHKLATVHRQALENPIIYVATKVREGEDIPDGPIGQTFLRLPMKHPERKKLVDMFIAKITDPETMILCGTNRTRTSLNTTVRAARNLKNRLPQKGEKLVCMKNAKDYRIFNGQILYAASDAVEIPDTNCFRAKLEGYGQVFTFYGGSLNTAPGNIFMKMDGDREKIREALGDDSSQKAPLVFDFGYACSVHKAQGSEWDNVLLFDETMASQSREDHVRWLYTGITRSRSKLCILHY